MVAELKKGNFEIMVGIPGKRNPVDYGEVFFGMATHCIVVHRPKTELEKINPPKEYGFPKVKEIVKLEPFISDKKDPNYDEPLSKLEKEY